MVTITIEQASADRFADAQHAITGGGDGTSCQCQWWMLPNTQYNGTTADQRKELLRAEMVVSPPPGLIAYVDGEAAGWVRVGPRTSQKRIARTKAIQAATHEPLDDSDVWAISCFAVRREFRGLNLMSALLDEAVTFARAGNARVIEAYPLDPTAAKTATNALFRGVLSTFEAAGFTVIARPKPSSTIVVLDLTG